MSTAADQLSQIKTPSRFDGNEFSSEGNNFIFERSFDKQKMSVPIREANEELEQDLMNHYRNAGNNHRRELSFE